MIGGSVACAARERGLCQNIVGLGRKKSECNLIEAKRLGVIDEYYTDIEPAIKDADLVVIATPVGTMERMFSELRCHWSDSTIYTDVGSTKGSVITAAKKIFGKTPPNFVPAHPIAGREKSGVQAAIPDLFQDKMVILTPLENTFPEALEKMRSFWNGLGSLVSFMDVDHHDAVLAATSHLPHILAYSLVDLLGRKDEQVEIFKFAAGGFKDFTRIASSDPTMWLDICLANKDEIVPLIHQLKDELDAISKMLEKNDSQQLFDTFTYAKNARQRFLDQFE